MNQTATTPPYIKETLNYLKFVLIILVVYAHSKPETAGNFKTFNMVQEVITYNLCAIAVPLLFLLSGYLFFREGTLNKELYVKKLKKRFKTLVIPYIFWTLAAVFVILVVAQRYLPNLFTGSFPNISTFKAKDWLDVFWIEPLQYQFWYLRDLFVTILLTPLIYLFIKKIGVFFLLGLLVLLLARLSEPIVGFSVSSIFYFSIGAFFAIKNIDFVKLSDKYFIPVTIIYAALFVVSVMVKNSNPLNFSVLVFMILPGMSFITGLVYRCRACFRKVPEVFYSSTFFLYAFHGLFIMGLVRLLSKVGLVSTDIKTVVLYLIAPIITIIVSALIYKVLIKIAPRFTKFITGGR